MDPVIVTVKGKGSPRLIDMEIQPDIAAMDVSRMVAENVGRMGADGMTEAFVIDVYPSGSDQARRLNPGDTLAQIGVWDGGWLVFMTIGEAGVQNANRVPNPATSQSRRQKERSPLSDWRKF